MNSIKIWLINVGIKKMGPSLIRAALAWVVAMLAAHAGMLESFGVSYDSLAKTVTLHVDTLQAWLVGGGLGLVTAALTAAQHHTVAAVQGTPQSGDKRENPPSQLSGGDRAEDPPKGSA